jgi:hypothetical protein
MLTKENFCLLVNGMKAQYDREREVHNILKKFDIYTEEVHNPLDAAIEKMIKINFPKTFDLIFDYAYPVFEREDIATEDLYNEIIEIEGDC